MRIDEAFKYLGGGCVVYAVMAACSGGGGGMMAMDAGSDATLPGVGGAAGAMGMGGAAPDAARDQAMADVMGSDGATGMPDARQDAPGVMDAMMFPDGMVADSSMMDATQDQGSGDVVGIMDALTDPVPDAMAQDAGTCGTCSVTGPVTVAEPLAVRTADTDAMQLRRGYALAPTAQVVHVASGPVVVTDATVGTGGVLTVAPTGDCSAAGRAGLPMASETHAARVLVGAGEALCLAAGTFPTSVNWSGFVPYS